MGSEVDRGQQSEFSILMAYESYFYLSNQVCYASEYSTVDPKNRLMEMRSKNMSFCNFVNMEEKMTYTPDPEDSSRTVMRQETVVTVQGVPLTSYMEGVIVNTVSSNSSKGRAAIEWIVEKLGNECRFKIFLSTFEIPCWKMSHFHLRNSVQ